VIELKDIASEIENIEQRTHTDEAKAAEINERLSTIYTLQKKHRLNTIAELLRLQDDLSEKIQQAVHGDEAIEKLQKQIATEKKELEQLVVEAKRLGLELDHVTAAVEQHWKRLEGGKP